MSNDKIKSINNNQSPFFNSTFYELLIENEEEYKQLLKFFKFTKPKYATKNIFNNDDLNNSIIKLCGKLINQLLPSHYSNETSINDLFISKLSLEVTLQDFANEVYQNEGNEGLLFNFSWQFDVIFTNKRTKPFFFQYLINSYKISELSDHSKKIIQKTGYNGRNSIYTKFSSKDLDKIIIKNYNDMHKNSLNKPYR
jgi:hypothetical protein